MNTLDYNATVDGQQRLSQSFHTMNHALVVGINQLKHQATPDHLHSIAGQLQTLHHTWAAKREAFQADELDASLRSLDQVVQTETGNLFSCLNSDAQAGFSSLTSQVHAVDAALHEDKTSVSAGVTAMESAIQTLEATLAQAFQKIGQAVSQLDQTRQNLQASQEQSHVQVHEAVTTLTQDIGATHLQAVSSVLQTFCTATGEQHPADIQHVYQQLHSNLEGIYSHFQATGADLANRLSGDVTALVHNAQAGIEGMVPDLGGVVEQIIVGAVKEMVMEVGLNIALMQVGVAFTSAFTANGTLLILVAAKKALAIINRLFDVIADLLEAIDHLVDKLGVVGKPLEYALIPVTFTVDSIKAVASLFGL